MKIVILILTFFYSHLYAQTGTKYYFKAVDWQIVLPQGFVLDNDSTKIYNEKEGVRIIENESHLKIPKDGKIDLINAAKGVTSHLSVTLSASNSPTEHHWDSINNNVIKILYKTFLKQAPGANFDSNRTTVFIDKMPFRKFSMNISYPNDVTVYNVFLMKFYRHQTFFILYYWVDEADGIELKNMILNSRFIKR